MPIPIATEAQMSAFLARAGFALTPEQVAEYMEPYGYILEMSARIRSERSYMAEPGHVFPAQAGFPSEETSR